MFHTYAQDHLAQKPSSEEMSTHTAFFNYKSVVILPHTWASFFCSSLHSDTLFPCIFGF